ncbi:hypothetical protein [uncultured Shewanella sp.]|uniref:hypothetical protein n=1 Tax=uncultured Shewanella sp. TaxID=173975 RepID=UPI002614A43D|nr:hypothetical protein [uncultured Shewanella sp.]
MSKLSKLNILFYSVIVICFFLSAVNSGRIEYLICKFNQCEPNYGEEIDRQNKENHIVTSEFIDKDSQGREYITPENMVKIKKAEKINRDIMINDIKAKAIDRGGISLYNKFMMLMSLFVVFYILLGEEKTSGFKMKVISLVVLLFVNLFFVQLSLVSVIFTLAILFIYVKKYILWFLPNGR